MHVRTNNCTPVLYVSIINNIMSLRPSKRCFGGGGGSINFPALRPSTFWQLTVTKTRGSVRLLWNDFNVTYTVYLLRAQKC